MFENRVLRRIFGPKRDEEAGEWRKLQNEELHGLYVLRLNYWKYQVEEDEVGGEFSANGGRRRPRIGHC
jgi:hypothetical protein